MSLVFSRITVAPFGEKKFSFWESGHPDEADVRELILRDKRYDNVVSLTVSARVIVQYYRHLPGPDDDALAEESHFALIDAYNEMAKSSRTHYFENRKDVEKPKSFSFRLVPGGF